MPVDPLGASLRLAETMAEAVGLTAGARTGFATPSTVLLELTTMR